MPLTWRTSILHLKQRVTPTKYEHTAAGTVVGYGQATTHHLSSAQRTLTLVRSRASKDPPPTGVSLLPYNSYKAHTSSSGGRASSTTFACKSKLPRANTKTESFQETQLRSALACACPLATKHKHHGELAYQRHSPRAQFQTPAHQEHAATCSMYIHPSSQRRAKATAFVPNNKHRRELTKRNAASLQISNLVHEFQSPSHQGVAVGNKIRAGNQSRTLLQST